MIMHAEVEEEGFPSSIAILGSDDAIERFFMLYFDERGVSRRFETTLQANTWKFWRDAPGFSQRFTGTIDETGETFSVVGELSEDDATWKRDIETKYTRIRE